MNYVQRKRTKGWRMPPNTLYCGRPGKYGNLYIIVAPISLSSLDTVADRDLYRGSITISFSSCEDAMKDMLSRYQDWFMERHGEAGLMELAQYDALSCWCEVGEPCHVQNVLIPLVEAWKESHK